MCRSCMKPGKSVQLTTIVVNNNYNTNNLSVSNMNNSSVSNPSLPLS